MHESHPSSDSTLLSRTLRFPPLVSKLADFFDGRDGEAYLVGGVVRDALLGIEAEDVDIAVAGDAFSVGGQIADAFGGRCVLLHCDWQVARVVMSQNDCKGNVDIAAIRGDIGSDLHGRDFTINAMAMPMDAVAADVAERRLIDPRGGLRDLRGGIVRMLSSDVFEDDPVRLMRGARLATQFSFTLDPETADAIRKRASLLAGVAQERVRDELMRLLQTPNACEGVRLLDDLELLCSVIPELAQAKGVTQPKEHYWDVFNHLVEAVGWVDAMFSTKDNEVFPLNVVPRFEGICQYFSGEVSDGFDRLAFFKLAALLHDVAKPATKTEEASGRVRFLGHHTEGEVMARDILRRLRIGNGGIEHVAAMVHYHLRPRQMAQKGDMPSRKALYRYYRYVGDVALDTLYLNTADYLAARGPMLEADDWGSHCRLIRYILDEGGPPGDDGSGDSLKSLPKLVSGYDIMDRFALAPGPIIGILLEEVREAQASGEVNTIEQALELVRASLERGGDGA